MIGRLETRSPRRPRAARPLAGVAETARWVATYRAWESARPDALFHDPFAARFAGARGEALARTLAQPAAGRSGWPIVTRTVLIDAAVERAVAELAGALAARPSLTEWVTDLASPAMVRMLRRGRERDLAEAPLRFGPADGVGFFEARGWRLREARSFLHEGARLRRLPWPLRPFAWVPPPDPRAPGRAQWAAVVRLERAP